MKPQTYSFLDVVAAIVGPGGFFNLAGDVGNAEEGVTVEPADDINTMQIGADGNGQHSLSADRSGQIVVRVLKTSPVNAQLAAMLQFQRASSSAHGQNTITIRDTARNDVITATGCAFKRWPSLNFQKQAGINEWVFDAIRIDSTLGAGS